MYAGGRGQRGLLRQPVRERVGQAPERVARERIAIAEAEPGNLGGNGGHGDPQLGSDWRGNRGFPREFAVGMTMAPSLRRPWLRCVRTASLLDPESEEVGVEEADRERDADAGEQPEPHDDRELRPAADFEVMMDRRHAQHPLAKAAVRDDLRDHRQHLDQRQARRATAAADACASGCASPAIAPPIASEPVSPMKIFAGAAFHHRKPGARAEHRGRDDRLVERLGAAMHVVDLRVPELGERDDHERART